jgi:hypothetical protein
MSMTYNPAKGVQVRPQNVAKPLTCKCGCSWLQEVHVSQYDSQVSTVIGQPVPPLLQVPFIIYVCIKCGNAVEQPLQFMGIDIDRETQLEIIRLINQRFKTQYEVEHAACQCQEVSSEEK